MMLRIVGRAARANYTDNPRSARWIGGAQDSAGADYACTRLRQIVFEPIIDNALVFEKSAKFFAMGSCFAREVERSLAMLGVDVLSLPTRVEARSRVANSSTNRYNTYSMLDEIRYALDLEAFDQRSIVALDEKRMRCLDLQSSRGASSGGYSDFDTVIKYRTKLNGHFARLASADVFILTLGLSETWFDHETGHHLNMTVPNEILDQYPDRFEFRVLTHAENMANLEAIYSILKEQVSPNLKIIVTTSPVPLRATFSGRDVVIANTYSKSTLRSCAELWCWSHPREIEYFPSYEMAVNSNPNLVWEPDRIHVQPIFVRQIMKHFVGNYILGAKEMLHNSVAELEEISATIAEASVGQASSGTLGTSELDVDELAAKCKDAFHRKDFTLCINTADQLLGLWSSTDGALRRTLRPAVTAGLRFACLASIRKRDIDRTMTFYHQINQINARPWGIAMQLAKSLRRLNETERLAPLVEQLKGWSKLSPEREAEFAEFTKSAA